MTRTGISEGLERTGGRLTAMETGVLEQHARGMSAAEIAAENGKSLNTIRKQINSARDRLGARNSAQAVARALRTGQIRG